MMASLRMQYSFTSKTTVVQKCSGTMEIQKYDLQTNGRTNGWTDLGRCPRHFCVSKNRILLFKDFHDGHSVIITFKIWILWISLPLPLQYHYIYLSFILHKWHKLDPLQIVWWSALPTGRHLEWVECRLQAGQNSRQSSSRRKFQTIGFNLETTTVQFLTNIAFFQFHWVCAVASRGSILLLHLWKWVSCKML